MIYIDPPYNTGQNLIYKNDFDLNYYLSEAKKFRLNCKTIKKLKNKNYIYKGKYNGNYCKACEEFFTDSQLKNNSCPNI